MVVPTFTRIGAIQAIVDTNLNSRGCEKKQIKDEIKKYCEKSPEFIAFTKDQAECTYCSKTLKMLKASVKGHEAALAKLTAETCDAVAKKYSIIVTCESNHCDFVREKLTKDLVAAKSDLAVITDKKNAHEEFEKSVSKLRQSLDKALKSRYSEWKKRETALFDERRKEERKVAAAAVEALNVPGQPRVAKVSVPEPDVFAHLRELAVAVVDSEYFVLCLNRDEISHKSVRASKTKLAARDLVMRAVVRYADAVHDTFCKRAAFVSNGNIGAADKKSKIPDVVLGSDFIGARLDGSDCFDGFFANEMFNGLSDATRHAEYLARCVDDDESKVFTSWVATYTKSTYSDEFSTDVVALIAALLIDLVARFSRCLQVGLRNHANLQTINIGLVHTLYESMFTIHGRDYEEIRSQIECVWNTPKTEVVVA